MIQNIAREFKVTEKRGLSFLPLWSQLWKWKSPPPPSESISDCFNCEHLVYFRPIWFSTITYHKSDFRRSISFCPCSIIGLQYDSTPARHLQRKKFWQKITSEHLNLFRVAKNTHLNIWTFSGLHGKTGSLVLVFMSTSRLSGGCSGNYLFFILLDNFVKSDIAEDACVSPRERMSNDDAITKGGFLQ